MKIKEAWPCDLRGFLFAMFNYDVVWQPKTADEEPPF